MTYRFFRNQKRHTVPNWCLSARALQELQGAMVYYQKEIPKHLQDEWKAFEADVRKFQAAMHRTTTGDLNVVSAAFTPFAYWTPELLRMVKRSLLRRVIHYRKQRQTADHDKSFVAMLDELEILLTDMTPWCGAATLNAVIYNWTDFVLPGKLTRWVWTLLCGGALAGTGNEAVRGIINIMTSLISSVSWPI